MSKLAKKIAELMQQQPAYAALGYQECVLVWAYNWAAGTAGAEELFREALQKVKEERDAEYR